MTPSVNNGELLLLLLLVSEFVSPCRARPKDWTDEEKDTFYAYLVLLMWAVVQWAVNTRLLSFLSLKYQVIRFWVTALYIECWIYVGFGWFLAGLVFAANGRIFSNMLAAVSAKTIAFLVLDKVPPPPKGIADCIDTIYNAQRVKWGYYEPGNNRDDIWVKFVQIYVKDGKHRQLRRSLEDPNTNFQTGKWEGINETEVSDSAGNPILRVNTCIRNNPSANLPPTRIRELYDLTENDRRNIAHAQGCIFSGYDFRVDARLASSNWLDVFHKECDGDWHHLLARQLQSFIPTEVLNVKLETELKGDTFLKSNLWGRLRRLAQLPQKDDAQPLTDIHLFEAAVYESFEQERGFQTVDEIVTVIYQSETYEEAAKSMFEYMCRI